MNLTSKSRVIAVLLLFIGALGLAGCAHKNVLIGKSYRTSATLVGIDKAEAYGRSMEWIATYYGDTKQLVKYADEGRGRIVASGRFMYKFEPFLSDPNPQWVYYDMIIDVNNGEARMAITTSDFMLTNKDRDLKARFSEHMDLTQKSFIDYVTTGGEMAASASWE